MASLPRARVFPAVLLLALAVAQGLPRGWAQDEPPRVIPDGVYRGRAIAEKGERNLKLEIRGTVVTGTTGDNQTLRLEGTYDSARGTVSGTVQGSMPVTVSVDGVAHGTREVAIKPCPFQGAVEGDQIVGTIAFYKMPPVPFTVDLGEAEEPEPPPPPERIAVSATIHMNPEQPKPGDEVELWATVTGPDGKALSGAHKIWDVGKSAFGNVDPRFKWDGKELVVKLTVVHQEQEYKFAKTIPAYTEAPPPTNEAPATTAEPAGGQGSEGSGAGLGVAAILVAAVAAAGAAVAGLVGALIAKLLVPAKAPVAPPAPTPPLPPPEAPPQTPEVPHVRRPTAGQGPEAGAEPPAAGGSAPPDADKPPEEKPEDEEPEDDTPADKPEGQRPEAAPAKPPEAPVDAAPDADGGKPDAAGDAPPTTTTPAATGSTAAPEQALGARPSDLATADELPVEDGPGEGAIRAQEIADLRERLQSIIDERLREGFFIRNPNVLSKVWNNTLGWALWDGALGYTGGQCGEAVNWGANWLPAAEVRSIFGPDATYDTIAIRNTGYGGALENYSNHTANRVILPDGRRYVIDFWEGLVTGRAGPALIPESEWIARWTRRVSVHAVSNEVVTSPPGSPMGPVLDALPTIRDPVGIERSGEEGALKDMITRHGREDGIRRYLASSRNKATRDGNPALFQAAQRLVRSYRRDPW